MVCLHSNETIVSSNHVVNMPELPEVEVTRMGIAPHIEGRTVRQMVVRQPQLRWLIDANLPEWLKNAQIERTERRSKYLIVHCACTQGRRGVLLIHLGMSGSLRIVAKGTPPQKHDHVDLVFENTTLRFRDPRRFGTVLWHEGGAIATHPLIAIMGVEPLTDAFNADWLYDQTRRRSMPIKPLLMDSHRIVGIGNIYASESLFLAGISPLRAAGSLSRPRCQRLAEAIRTTLQNSIAAGGSSVRDYVHSDGGAGSFQLHCAVYDRAGEACPQCQRPIRSLRQAGRSSFYCAHCQR